jgi:hypothetical protein
MDVKSRDFDSFERQSSAKRFWPRNYVLYVEGCHGLEVENNKVLISHGLSGYEKTNEMKPG